MEEEKLQKKLSTLVPGATLSWQEIPDTSLQGLLLNEETANRPLPPECEARVMESPPFWSLLWPAGNFLCRLFSKDKASLKGRVCVDLGSGSGLVAAAMAKSGADVLACDRDNLSLAVTELTARRNKVRLRLSQEWVEPCETLILADFLYDPEQVESLPAFISRSEEILIVDSRLKELSHCEFTGLGAFQGQAVPDLDPHREFACLNLWYYGRRLNFWKRLLLQ